MCFSSSNIEAIDISRVPLENAKLKELSPVERSYLEELGVSDMYLKEMSLDDLVERARTINDRIEEVHGRTGISKNELFQVAFPEIATISTRQHGWEGKEVHGVKYSMQTFVSSTQELYRGVFPEFPARCEIRLPDYCMSDAFWSKYGDGTDRMQMKYATIELKNKLLNHPTLREDLKLTDCQYADIMEEKDKIAGLTWHHDIDFGRMKLIDEDVHSFKEHQHSGGMATWNKCWIQSHLIRQTDSMKVEALIDHIDELNECEPPKAIDSDPKMANLIEPMIGEIDPTYLEAPQDSLQIEAIADQMADMEGLDFREWKELSLQGRMDVLERVEKRVADIAHRPACELEVKELGAGHLGYYSNGENKITLNESYVQSNSIADYREVLDTLIHEGRHAYQDYNLHVREVHPRQGDITNWKLNEFGHGYQDVKHCGFQSYEMQPLESDARAFAEDVLQTYQNKLA